VIVIQKPLSSLQNVLQKPHEAFQGFGSEFTELHAKFDADRTKHEVEKALV
jgi:hypothetical protein